MILVTGATGFLGAELARQLVYAGLNITCIKREHSVIPKSLQPFTSQISWRDADLLDFYALEDAFENITQVYHCAAWVSFNQAHREQMIKTNVEGTANIVNLCAQAGARLVHVSSIAAIGEAKPGELISENNHLEESPYENAYAISKYESEMEVWRAIAEGLDAAIVNPSLIIGAAAGKSGSGKIFDKVKNGLKFYTSGGCGFVDVEDVARCMVMLMNSTITGQRYIVSGENISYEKLFLLTANFLGVGAPKIAAPAWALNAAWRVSAMLSFLTGRQVGIDKISAQSASKTLYYNNAKIKAAIEIQFIPLQQTVKQICEALMA